MFCFNYIYFTHLILSLSNIEESPKYYALFNFQDIWFKSKLYNELKNILHFIHITSLLKTVDITELKTKLIFFYGDLFMHRVYYASSKGGINLISRCISVLPNSIKREFEPRSFSVVGTYI